MARLDTDRMGLEATEVAARSARYGPNTLPHAKRTPWYVELIANFVHFFAVLLWAAAGLAAFAGMPQLAWAIVAVILVNGLFSYWQEYQTEREAEALAALLPQRVRVRRAGQEQAVPAAELVPGDLLVLPEGEAVPADARLIAAERLRLDLSALTGELRSAPRAATPVEPAGRSAAELPNRCSRAPQWPAGAARP